MSAKLHFLTDVGPGWSPLLRVSFDLACANKLSVIYASQRNNATSSSGFAYEAVIRKLSHPGQPVAGTNDLHSPEFC